MGDRSTSQFRSVRLAAVAAIFATTVWSGAPGDLTAIANTTTTGFETVHATVLGDDVAVQASVVADGRGGMYSVYRDDIAGGSGIFLRASTDGGAAWSEPMLITPLDANWYAPSIAVRNSTSSTELWVSALRFTCKSGGSICGYQPVLFNVDADGSIRGETEAPYQVPYEPAALSTSSSDVTWGFRRSDGTAIAIVVLSYTGGDGGDFPNNSTRIFPAPVRRIDVTSAGDLTAVTVATRSVVEVVTADDIRRGAPARTLTLGDSEMFLDVAVSRNEVHVLTARQLPSQSGAVAGRLDPANQSRQLRVRTATLRGALAGGFAAPVVVGETPEYGFGLGAASIAGTADSVGVVWEDAATRQLVTAVSTDRGVSFGPPTRVPGSLGADNVALEAVVRPPSTAPVARFGWSVADTFVDVDGDGRPDPRLTAVPADLQMRVTLDGCRSRSGGGVLASIAEYRWYVEDVAVDGTTACRIEQRLTADQAHSVRLVVVRAGDGATSETEQQVRPRNMVIASLGDGIASGEGNPDVASTFDPSLDAASIVDADLQPAVWQDRACHRSAAAGPAIAARRMELADPHSAVTFFHLACSGASIMSGDTVDPAAENRAATGGLLDPYQGVEPTAPTTDESQARPSQLDQLAALLGPSGHDVDALMLSVGGSDVRLGDVITGCLTPQAGERDGCDRLATKTRFDQRLTALPDRFVALADALGSQFPELAASPDRVVLSDYADPTGDDRGLANLRCVANSEAIGQVAVAVAGITDALTTYATLTPAAKAFLGALNKAADVTAILLGGGDGLITDTEALWLSRSVYQGLNGVLRDAANGYGWRHVDGISATVARRGYCADDANRDIVGVGESLWQQTDLFGAFQPDADGQRAYANALARELSRLLPPDGVVATSDDAGAQLSGGVGDYVLAFRAPADLLPTSGDTLVVADLAVRGSALETTSARRIDAVVAPPARFSGTWYQGHVVAADARVATVAWTQTMHGPSGDLWRSLVARAYVGRPDIAVEKVSLVQAPDQPLRLAEGKATVARSTLQATLAGPTDVAVRVLVVGADGDIHDQTYPVRLVDGANDVVLPPTGSLPLPEGGDSWSVRVEVTDPGASGPDLTDGSNDWRSSDAIAVVASRPLRVLFAPVDGTGATCAETSALASRAIPYARATLPVPEGAVSAAFGGTSRTAPGGCPSLPSAVQTSAGVGAALSRLDRLARLAGVDVIAGVVASGWLQNAFDDGDPWGIALLGAAGNPMRGTLLEAQTFDNVLTHEMTHLLGYDHTPINDTTGLWVSRRAARQGPDYLRVGATRTRWASAATYDGALDAISGSPIPTPDGAGPAIRISGRLALDSVTPTIDLDPWVAAAGPDPASASTLTAVQIDAAGDTLRVDPLPLAAVDADYAGPGPTIEPEPTSFVFAHAVALDPATTGIRLLLDGVEVATRAVSATDPSVTVTAPTAGQVVPVGEPLTVTWDTVDPDPDTVLTHSVLISSDGGTTWQPLAMDLAETTFTFDVPAGVAGDNVVVRVVSTDGVRSGVGLSAPFTVRSIERGPEQVYFERIEFCADFSGFAATCPTGLSAMAPDGSGERSLVEFELPVADITAPAGIAPLTRAWWPMHPSISPDGRTLAFDVQWENARYTVGDNQVGIAVADHDGANRRLITNVVPVPGEPFRSLRISCPSWSPDGTRIAALGGGSGDSRAYVLTMAPDGSDLRFAGVQQWGNGQVCPSWSPDGNRLAVAVRRTSYDIASLWPADMPPLTPDTMWTLLGWDSSGNDAAVGQLLGFIGRDVDPTTGNRLGELGSTAGSVGTLVQEPDGSILAPLSESWILCGVVRILPAGAGQERVMTCPRTRIVVATDPPGTGRPNISGYDPPHIQYAPDGRLAISSGKVFVHASYVDSLAGFTPSLCTIPGDSLAEPLVQSTLGNNYLPPGHECVTGPGTTAPTPLVASRIGQLHHAWSAGVVLDSSGGGGSALDILQPADRADAGGPYTTDEDTDLTLDASGSGLTAPGAEFDWDLDGDGAFDDAVGMQPVVRFSDAGDVTVRVRVTSGAATADDDAVVTVQATGPSVAEPRPQFALVSAPSTLGPFHFADDGAGEHEAWIEVDGRRFPGSVDGRSAFVSVTLDRLGSVEGTLGVCDAGSGPCTTVPVAIEVEPRPVVTGVFPGEVSSAGGATVGVIGRHLGATTELLVGGRTVPVSIVDGAPVFRAPPGTAGDIVEVAVDGSDGGGELRYVDRTAVDQRLVTPQDTELAVILEAFDAITAETTSAPHVIVTPPSHGQLMIAPANADGLPGAPETVVDSPVIYAPDAGFVGTDRIEIRAVGDERVATITIKVGNVAPIVGADTITVPTGRVTEIDPAVLLANDSDPDAADWVAVSARRVLEASGLNLAAVYGPAMTGAVWFDADGHLFVASPKDASGSTNFEYVVVDPQGALGSGIVTVRFAAAQTTTTIIATTTTSPATSTTTVNPPPPTTSTPHPTGGLPATGSSPSQAVRVAVALVALGSAMIAVAGTARRRRRSVRS